MSIPHYFIAIPLPSSVKQYLANWQVELGPRLPYKLWTNEHDLHITLKFLGAVEEEPLQRLQEALHTVKQQNHFTLSIGSIGTFGTNTSPRVLWTGVEKPEQLSILHNQVEMLTRELGFSKDERAYRPHITLAKKWNGPPAGDSIKEVVSAYTNHRQLLQVNEIVIYQIYPNQTPKYKIHSVYRLKGGGMNGSVD